MISSSDDGVRARGASFNDGVLWIKADADGVETTGDLTIVGGNLLIMSSASEKNSALKAEHDIVISGGNVVALGSGEQKSPLVSSANPATQKSLTATLNSAVSTGSTVYIKNVDTNVSSISQLKATLRHSFIAPRLSKRGITKFLSTESSLERALSNNARENSKVV